MRNAILPTISTILVLLMALVSFGTLARHNTTPPGYEFTDAEVKAVEAIESNPEYELYHNDKVLVTSVNDVCDVLTHTTDTEAIGQAKINIVTSLAQGQRFGTKEDLFNASIKASDIVAEAGTQFVCPGVDVEPFVGQGITLNAS